MAETTKQIVSLNAAEQDRAALFAKLTDEVSVLMAEVNADPRVAAAAEQLQVAESEAQAVHQASMALAVDCASLRREADEALTEGRSELVRSRATNAPFDIRVSAEKVKRAESALAFARETQTFLQTHLIKLVSIRELRARGEHLRLQGRVLSELASKRMEETMRGMASALAREGSLGLDPKSTLSGQLIDRAQQMQLDGSNQYWEAENQFATYRDNCIKIQQQPLPEDYKI